VCAPFPALKRRAKVSLPLRGYKNITLHFHRCRFG